VSNRFWRERRGAVEVSVRMLWGASRVEEVARGRRDGMSRLIVKC
jgi:hypothetical protein